MLSPRVWPSSGCCLSTKGYERIAVKIQAHGCLLRVGCTCQHDVEIWRVAERNSGSDFVNPVKDTRSHHVAMCHDHSTA